jgi:hypothetical protein
MQVDSTKLDDGDHERGTSGEGSAMKEGRRRKGSERRGEGECAEERPYIQSFRFEEVRTLEGKRKARMRITAYRITSKVEL